MARTDHRSPLIDLDIAGQTHVPDLYDITHAAGWEPWDGYDLLIAHDPRVGSVL